MKLVLAPCLLVAFLGLVLLAPSASASCHLMCQHLPDDVEHAAYATLPGVAVFGAGVFFLARRGSGTGRGRRLSRSRARACVRRRR